MTSAYQTPPMVQGGRPRRHLRAKVTVSNCHLKEASMEPAITIGLDIAKHVFQVHGGGCRRPCVVPQAPHVGEAAWVLSRAGVLRCGDGGLRRLALLGSGDRQVGPRSATDSAGLRQAVRETAEE